jgi:ATP/maltotriose-dependent transcriptional regulator MalT
VAASNKIDAAHPQQGLRSSGGPAFVLAQSKLGLPWIRPGIVARTGLVERLLDASATPVICVVAPPGYGKTTLLGQWAQRKATVWAG